MYKNIGRVVSSCVGHDIIFFKFFHVVNTPRGKSNIKLIDIELMKIMSTTDVCPVFLTLKTALVSAKLSLANRDQLSLGWLRERDNLLGCFHTVTKVSADAGESN